MIDACPTCGQALPGEAPYQLTPRAVDVLAAWWITDSVKAAAQMAGVGEQRAKNILANARMRSRVPTNHALLAQHFSVIRLRARELMHHNEQREEAA